MKKRIVIIVIIILIFAATIAAAGYLMKSKNNSAGPVDTQGRTGSNFEIGKETVPKAGLQAAPKTKVAPKSTKEIFASAPKQIEGRLVKIIFRRMPLGENKKLTNTLAFVYYDDSSKKTTETDYAYERGGFTLNPKPIPVPANSETVPVSAVDLGYEGMKNILAKDAEYLKYRGKYPQLLGNCSSTLAKNKQFGWEWITSCSSVLNKKKTSVSFTMNLDTKKVSVIKKVNLE